MRVLIGLVGFVILGVLLGACASPKRDFKVGHIDQAIIETDLSRQPSGQIEPINSGTFKFASALEGGGSTVSWSCSLPLNLTYSGNLKEFTRRMQRPLAKVFDNLKMPSEGKLYNKSNLEKKGFRGKAFKLKLGDLLGTYQLKRLDDGKVGFVNPQGFYFGSFLQSEKGLALELSVALDSKSPKADMGNVLCAEIESGIEFRPAAE